jgi:hypothetical protein
MLLCWNSHKLAFRTCGKRWSAELGIISQQVPKYTEKVLLHPWM